MDKTASLSIEESEKLTSSTENLQQLLKEKNLEIERIKQRNSLLEAMFDNLPGRIFCKDLQGAYLLSNSHDAKMTRAYAMEEAKGLDHFLGKTDEEIFPAKLAKLFRNTDLEVICSGKSLVTECKYFNAEGKPIIESATKIPLYNAQDQIIGTMGYCFDITYLKSLEIKVKKADTDKIEFIRHMQHDIKTPFTGITGLTNILLERETDSEKSDFLKDIILCANELMEYCDRILDFSKATVKNLPLVTSTFPLHDMVDSVINIGSPVAKIKQLHLSLDYAESLPKIVIGYPYRLKSILVNLLNNSLQYTQQGQIRLIVRPKTIAINNSLILLFIIKDTGQGMSSEKRIAIEKQLNDSPTVENDTYEGRGLGLRIIAQFAKDIGGKVFVTSELEMGTTFTVEVPLEISQV